MKSVKTLIKLQKSKVDEQRRVIAEHQKALDRVEQELVELAAQQAREQEVAREKPEQALTYGQFIKWALQRTQDLHNARAAILQALENEREVLALLFEEQKRYEIVDANREQAEALAEEKREQAALDETAVMNFERKSRE